MKRRTFLIDSRRGRHLFAVHPGGLVPFRAKLGMVVTQNDIASQIGFQVIENGGNAIDAAVATAFALAVTHPTAGNIGGGGFIVYRRRPASRCLTTSARWRRPRSSPEMWLKDGKYDFETHHNSHLSVGVPGTVAGLHLAWKEQGSKPWKDSVQPAVKLARDGFEIIARPRPIARSDDSGNSRSIPPRSRSSRRTAAVSGRRDPQAARSREDADAHRRPGTGRVLRGRNRAR